MRKSPLSRPSGNEGNSSFNRYRRKNNREGYGYGLNDSYHQSFSEYNSQHSPVQRRTDFIPLEASSPMSYNRRNKSGNWRNSGNHNWFSGGYNSQQNSFYNSPSSHPNNSYSSCNSPYRGKHFRGNGKNSQNLKNISNYFDAVSIFENPWELLEQSHLLKSLDSGLSRHDSSTEVLLDSSKLSQESTNESMTDTTTDLSDVSQEAKQNSSVDLKMDNFIINSLNNSSQSSEEKLNLSPILSNNLNTEISVDLM